jgi:hypothetical protein
MRITTFAPAFVRACLVVLTVLPGGLLSNPAPSGGGERPQKSAVQPADARLAPYAADAEHPWNRLHQGFFVRESDGARHIHSTDPLLYRGGTYLLVGEPHRKAVALLDRFLAKSEDGLIDDPLKRLFFQHDLWSAFDYVAWYPDDWVFKSKYEPAAIALRNRLAKAVGRLALDNRELADLPDNYALAVKSKQFATAYDPAHPERPFLPPDLFDEKGPWVRFHPTNAEPTAPRHFLGAGGRAVHITFLRLPGGRAATEQYLKELRCKEPRLKESARYPLKQFPVGTKVALVRRALTVDRSAKVRGTPVTELVQIRVYRRIPKNPEADFHGDAGEQDVYEFLLDRQKLFAGEHGLRAFGRDDPAEPFFDRHEGADPFERNSTPFPPKMPQLKTCAECHTPPGIYSVVSVQQSLRPTDNELFRTYAWDVEMNYTVNAKVKQFGWGLLQGKLEAK